jgi:hypothetical protein
MVLCRSTAIFNFTGTIKTFDMKKNVAGVLLLAAVFSILAGGCDKDNDNKTVSVGDSYQGGKVAYILQSGDPGYDPNTQHGLIAAIADQSTGIMWYNGAYTTTGAIAQELGTGQANTTAIVANQGAGNYAAKICDDLVLNGYNDWYLPSWQELVRLYNNRTAIGGFASDVNSVYWSSSEVVALTPPNAGAFIVIFSSGQSAQTNKENVHMIRAIRSF